MSVLLLGASGVVGSGIKNNLKNYNIQEFNSTIYNIKKKKL